ncbi:MAG: hypothetical protein JWO31_3409 [Phycisphaerales bacterium]|nr:hypothetical protein [Phycisphaerales bacterium]
MTGGPPSGDYPTGGALYAPWRMGYIKGLSKPPGEQKCFLCEAAAVAANPAATDADRRDKLVLWATEHSVVLLNRYPYANGHVLVAPIAHHADLDLLDAAGQADLMVQTTAAVGLLRRAVSAQGFNVGINLGRCAGAGVPGHLHQHVVPRWAGDVNFMGVVGETQVVPEALSRMWEELQRGRAEEGK